MLIAIKILPLLLPAHQPTTYLLFCILRTTDFVPNGSDSSARYTYERQPEICRWNLGKLAEALAPFVSEDAVRRGLEDFDTVYSTAYMALMRGKLGLLSPKPGKSPQQYTKLYNCRNGDSRISGA
jgi:uncharacterized protein YdiU (UPF0061 family)